MNHRKLRSINQSGSTLIITILVLAAVTILGIMSLNTVVVEMDTGRNERASRISFYLAESAAIEAIQRVSNASIDDLNDHIQQWHHGCTEKTEQQLNFRLPDTWHADGSSDDNAMVSSLDPNTFFAAVESDVAPGASLVMTESRLYQNNVFGYCKRDNADTVVEIGYAYRY